MLNAQATLHEAVASILFQTYQDWELIAVNDGSTDASGPMLDAFAHQDARIKVLHHNANKGIVESLLAAFARSQAPLIARMDADDVCLPTRLERQVAFLHASPQIGLVGTQVAHLGDPATQQGYAAHIEWMNALLSPEAIALSRFVESPFAHPSVMFRRSMWDQHGGYLSGDWPEDYELWLRWMSKGVQMARIPEVLLHWRDLPSRLSRNHAMYGVEAFYHVRARYLAQHVQDMGTKRPIWVWGAGRVTRRRADLLLAYGIAIAGYIDIDPKKIGQVLDGRKVIGPAQLPSPGEIFILSYVSNRGAREEIRAHLTARGYAEGVDYLLAG